MTEKEQEPVAWQRRGLLLYWQEFWEQVSITVQHKKKMKQLHKTQNCHLI